MRSNNHLWALVAAVVLLCSSIPLRAQVQNPNAGNSPSTSAAAGQPAPSNPIIPASPGLNPQATPPASPTGALTAPVVPPPVPNPENPGSIPTTVAGIIVDVRFNGLNHIRKDLIAPRLQSRVGAAYSQQTVEQDAQALLDTGYFYSVRPRVEQSTVGTTVVFELVENPYIASIDITGNKVIKTKTLLDLMLSKPNQVLNTQLLRADLHKIEDDYANQGYIYAHVLDVKSDAATGIIHITVGEGIVERIDVVGNKKTYKSVVLHPIKTKPGTIFNLKQWRNDLKAIARLNIFSDIHYDRAPGNDLGKVVLVLTVVEQRTGTVNFGFGYNTRERGVIFLDLADTNFRGRAESVDAQLELGGYRTRGSYTLSFFEPWLGATQYSAGASVYDKQTDRIVPGTTGNTINGRYYETRIGEVLTLGRRYSETTQLLTDIKHEDVSSNEIYGSVATVFGGSTIISSSNVSPFLLQGGQINSLTLRGIQDTRDLPLNPRTGTFDELTVEPGTGTFHNPGDTGSHLFNYLRLSADLRKYIGVGAITHKEDKEIQKVLAMRLLYGRTSSGVPAFEYFFLGGADTLRGYNDDNFFGQNLLLGSLELRVPIALDKLQWVAFVDAGDSWGGNYTADTGMRLYPDAGAGVRVIIPSIGPLRLDYAYGSYGPRLQFSIGQTF